MIFRMRFDFSDINTLMIFNLDSDLFFLIYNRARRFFLEDRIFLSIFVAINVENLLERERFNDSI